MKMKPVLAGLALAVALGGAAQAATVTIQNVGGTIVYGTLSYAGADSDIQGYYNGAFSDLLAERFPAGNNADESALVGGIAGISGLDLGGTELPITGSSATIAGYTYFTAKFGQSLAVFYNALSTSITVTFAPSDTCRSQADSPSHCGGISHYKHVTVTPVPLPAAGFLLLGTLGGLLALRRKVA
jgi:opacity protein-like surface antigen